MGFFDLILVNYSRLLVFINLTKQCLTPGKQSLMYWQKCHQVLLMMLRNVHEITSTTRLFFCPSSVLWQQLRSWLCACYHALKTNKKTASVNKLISCAFLIFWIPNWGVTQPVEKEMIKAIYSYKISIFTVWPKSKLNDNQPFFNFCVIGHNPFTKQTQVMLAEKTVQQAPIAFKIFPSGLAPKKNLAECHILYISHSERHRVSTIIKAIQSEPVLTISDIPHFDKQGGMISLWKKNQKMRFYINMTAIKQANLSLSSKILKLNEKVKYKDE